VEFSNKKNLTLPKLDSQTKEIKKKKGLCSINGLTCCQRRTTQHHSV